MTTERLSFDGAADRAPDPTAAPARPGNRPADNARQLRPGDLAAGAGFPARSGAVDFLGLDQELASVQEPPAAQGDESWLMQVADEPPPEVAAAPEQGYEPEVEIEAAAPAAPEAGEPLAAPQLYNAAWNEKPVAKRRRLALPVAAGATAAALALAAIPLIRSSGADDEPAASSPRVAAVEPRAPAAPDARVAAAPADEAHARASDSQTAGGADSALRSVVEPPSESGGREPVAAQAPAVEDPFAIVIGDAGRTDTARRESAPPPEETSRVEPTPEPPAAVAVAATERVPQPEPSQPTPDAATAPAPPPAALAVAAESSEPTAVDPASTPRRPRAKGSKRRAEVAAVVEDDAAGPIAPNASTSPTAPSAASAVAAADAAPRSSPAHASDDVAAPTVVAVASPLGPALAGVAAPGSTALAIGPPLALASDAAATAESGTRTSRLRIEDVLLLESEATALRTASASDLRGVWSGTTIPYESIGAPSKLLTPQVGKVRLKTASGELFEGGLYAVGEGQIWLDTGHGRIALPAAKVETLSQIDVPPATAAFGASAPKEERVRIRTPGGVLYGRVVQTDERKTTIMTDDGARLTVDTALVERLTELPRITLKKD